MSAEIFSGWIKKTVTRGIGLGCFLKDAGDLSGCVGAYHEAVKLRPRFVPGLLNLGVLLRAPLRIGELPEDIV